MTTSPSQQLTGAAIEVDKAAFAHRATARPLPGWPIALGASASTTLVAAGAAPILTAFGTEAIAASAAVGGLATAAVTTRVFCSGRRREIAANAQASLERIAGPVRRFRARRWRGGLIGTPQIVRFVYQPAATVANKTWPGVGAAALAAVFGGRYAVSRHDPRLGKITLRLRPDVTDESRSVAVERATTMMLQLFGQTSTVEVTEEGTTLSRIAVEHECGVKATFPVWRERVERVVTTMLEGRWRARWDLSRDKVIFELRPTMQNFVTRPAPDLTAPHLLPLGIDEDGQVIAWDLHSSLPHFLVSGKTGKGKTVVLRGVVMEAAAREIKVWVCDPKRVELIGLRDLPNVQIVATTTEEQVVAILHAWELMEQRYADIADGTATEDDFDLVLLVVDEFAEFSRRVAQWWSRVKTRGMPTACPVMEKFDSLVRLGRTAGIRVAIGIQRPDVRFFGESGESRDNFDSRISLGRLSSDGSRMMWGSSIGTSLPGVRGRAIACTSEDNATEIQTYWVPDPRRIQNDEERQLLARFWPPEAKHPPLEITIPEPTVDSKGIVNVWGSIVDATMEPRTGLVPEDEEDAPTEETSVPVDDRIPPSQPQPVVDPDTDAERSSAQIVAFPKGRRPRRTRAVATPPVATPPPPPPPSLEVSAEADYGDPLAEYGAPMTLSPDEVVDGQLLELEPDTWAVIESVEQDLGNDQEWILNWRSIDPDTDDFGSIIVPSESTVQCRGMLERDA